MKKKITRRMKCEDPRKASLFNPEAMTFNRLLTFKIFKDVCMFLCVCMYVCMYEYMYVCMDVRIYARMCLFLLIHHHRNVTSVKLIIFVMTLVMNYKLSEKVQGFI